MDSLKAQLLSREYRRSFSSFRLDSQKAKSLFKNPGDDSRAEGSPRVQCPLSSCCRGRSEAGPAQRQPELSCPRAPPKKFVSFSFHLLTSLRF